jgi:dipeptidyl-peptidase 4
MLTLNSIFSSTEYLDEGFARPRWCADGSRYTTLRRTGNNVREILLHHPQNSDPSAIQTLVSAEQLYPHGSTTPLLIDDYVLSNDQKKVLLFTNSQKVWRLNTKGCYWVISLQDSTQTPTSPFQLGSTLLNPNILMFATFSPCNSRVAYVYENNIYCEDLSSHQITQLTFDGNENIINGTFDWVYEEEFHLRNGYR